MKPVLELSHFSKTYPNGKKAVDDLSLTVNPGEIRGFIGHNGAGKTTTLKAISGIIDLDEGSIAIDGHSVKDEPLLCKKITAYLPDNPDLYEHLTGIQYLNFIADVFGMSKQTRTEKIKKYADAFELTNNLGELISSYSHGMKQKLAIISCLIHNPKLWILDEPFVGLDPKASYTLKEYMKEHCHNGGGVFFSTHVLEVAEKLCTHIAILRNGKLVRSGETAVLSGGRPLDELFMDLLEESEV